jgi:hypothetical protein
LARLGGPPCHWCYAHVEECLWESHCYLDGHRQVNRWSEIMERHGAAKRDAIASPGTWG